MADDDFVPDDDFIPDNKGTSLGEKVQKFGNWALTSLLPEAQTGHTDTFVGANIPGLNKIYPGGIQVPNLRHLYDEVIRPAVSPLGIASTVGGMAAMRSPKAAVAPQAEAIPPEVIPQQKYLPLPRGKTGTPSTGFVHGQEGIAENRPYNIDTGQPIIGSGTVMPHEAGEVVKVPPEIAATYGTGLGKPARAPLPDKYTGFNAPKRLNAAPEQQQLPAGQGFTGYDSGVLPTTKGMLDVEGAPAPEPFKAEPKFDINANIQGIINNLQNPEFMPDANQPGMADMLKEFITSEEGTLKPEVLTDVKNKIFKALRTSQRISIPDIYSKVKDQITKKQFDRIIDQMLNEGPPKYTASKEQVPINPSTDYVRNPTDAIAKLTEAIRTAGPQREMQEQLYTQERGKRIAEVKGVKTSGLEGMYERFGKLKGELPKVDYEGLRLNKIDVDNLADAITNNHKITEWEKMNAREGLLKILTGSGVPQRSELALLSRVFGQEFSDTVFMHGGLLLPGKMRPLAELNNIMKTMVSAFDGSFPLRQGAGLIHTKAFWKSFANMWKTAEPDLTQFPSPRRMSEPGRIAYKTTMDAIESNPRFLFKREAGLSLTSLDNVTTREDSFLKSQAEKIPGINTSERLAYAFLNKLRDDVSDRWLDMAEAAGERISNNGEPTQLARDIMKVVNTTTFRGNLGSLEKIAPELNEAFFSPRGIKSRLDVLNPKWYVGLDPFARQRALRSAMALAGMTVLKNSLYALAGAEIGTNILSSDWMKAKIDDTRIESSTGIQGYLVALARFIKGETDSKIKYGPMAPTRGSIAANFVVPKLAPLENLVATLAMGQKDKEGNLTRYGQPINIPYEIAQKFIAMFPKDMYELYKNDPNLFPLGEGHFSPKLLAIPESFLGSGVNTYDKDANKPVRHFRIR